MDDQKQLGNQTDPTTPKAPSSDHNTAKKRAAGLTKLLKIPRFVQRHLTSILVIVIVLLAAIIVISDANKTIHTSKSIDFGLEDIGEFATQVGYYTNVNTITKPDRTIAGVPIPGTSSKAIMTYQGEIRAGMDFGQIQMDIDTESKVVTLTMPAVRILGSDVDTSSCEIYDESSNIFNQINIADVNTSLSEMKQRAEEQALKNGILDAAKNNAEVLIQNLFKNATGTDGYQLVFQWSNNT